MQFTHMLVDQRILSTIYRTLKIFSYSEIDAMEHDKSIEWKIEARLPFVSFLIYLIQPFVSIFFACYVFWSYQDT